MKRLFEFLFASRCEIIDLCVNFIKYKFNSSITRVIRRLAEYLIQGSILTSFVHSILLDNRITSICEKFDALYQPNSPPTCQNADCIVRHFCLPVCQTTETRSEYTVKSQGSDMRVEIGSRGASDFRRVSEFPRKRKRKRERSVTYKINPPRGKWRNARLRIVVYNIIPKDRDHLTKLRTLRRGRLRLPCKPIYLMLEILQADPALLDIFVVARRNFEDGVHKVSNLLNNISGKLDIGTIKKLRLKCEIYPGRINFKLASGSIGKSKHCLFKTRVLISQDIYNHDFLLESNTFPHPFQDKESEIEVCKIQVNQEKNSECDKCDIFYSPCSDTNFIPDRSAILEIVPNHHETDDLVLLYSNITTVKQYYVETCDKEICTIQQYVNRPSENQSIQCENDTLRKTVEWRTAETNTIVGIYKEKCDVDCDCRINNTDEIVQTDNQALPTKQSCSVQASKVKVNDTATDCHCYQTEDRGSSPVFHNKQNNSMKSLKTGSKTVSIQMMESRLSKNSADKYCRTSQPSIRNYKVDDIGDIDSRPSRVAIRFNNTSRISMKKSDVCACSGDFSAKFNETKATVRSLMTVQPEFSTSSSEEHYHIRRNKIQLVSKVLHSHERSPKSTFVRTTLRYVRNPKNPVQYSIRISSNSFTKLERLQSRIETSRKAKIEQKHSLLSCMKKRALRNSDRLKSRICRSSQKSLNKIKHLIHRKLRGLLLTSQDKATSTSKLILTENGYFISVSGVKSRHRRIFCDPRFQSKIDKFLDKSSSSKYPCKHICACGINHERLSSVQNRILEETRKGSFNSYQRNQCHCYKNILGESKCRSNENSSRSKPMTSNTNDHRKREFHTRNLEGSVLRAKHAHNRHSIKKAASQANKEYDSRYCNTKDEKCPIPSTNQCFLQVSKLIGLTNTCEQCINDMETDLRMKLPEYVTLCKSAKDTLMKDSQEDIFQGSETFPAPYSNRFSSR